MSQRNKTYFQNIGYTKNPLRENLQHFSTLASAIEEGISFALGDGREAEWCAVCLGLITDIIPPIRLYTVRQKKLHRFIFAIALSELHLL